MIQCPECETDHAPLFFVQCPECDEGEVWTGRWAGDWYSPPEDNYGPCPHCLGSGFVLSDDPAEEITLQDVQRIDEEIPEVDPCANGCQYAKDVGMWPEHSCGGECQYKLHRPLIDEATASRVWPRRAR